MEINMNTSSAAAQEAVKHAAETPKSGSEAKPPVTDARPAETPRNLTDVIIETLNNYGLKSTPENIKMAQFLLDSKIPVTEDNIKLVNQALKLLGADDAKILFFLENQIKLNAKNTETLQNFAEHKTAITNQLSDLFDLILKIGDNSLKNQILLELLGARQDGTGQADNLMGKLLENAFAREAGGQTGGQASGQVGGQTGGQASGQVGGQAGGQASGQVGSQAAGQASEQVGSQAVGQASRQVGSQAAGQANSQAGSQTLGQVNAQILNQAGGQIPTQTAEQTLAQTGGQASGQANAQILGQANGRTSSQTSGINGTGDVRSAQDAQATTQTPQADRVSASGVWRNFAEKALSAASNKAELDIIKDALIKALNGNERQISRMADLILENLATKKSAAAGEGNIAANAAKIPDITQALRLIERMFPNDALLREKIIESTGIFSKDNAQLKAALMSKFSLNPENLSKEVLYTLIKQLNENLSNIAAKHEAFRQLPQILYEIAEIKDSFSFLAHMKNNIFVQIPLIINGEQKTGELYVFKDRNKKNKSSGSLSALIALDTAYLGRFETYIVKQGNQVNLQFRLENDISESLVKQNIHMLNDAVNAHGLYITGVTYKKITESFSLLKKEPDGETALVSENGTFVFDKII